MQLLVVNDKKIKKNISCRWYEILIQTNGNQPLLNQEVATAFKFHFNILVYYVRGYIQQYGSRQLSKWM